MITTSGGTCDCGDPNSWKPGGACSRHGCAYQDDDYLFRAAKAKSKNKTRKFGVNIGRLQRAMGGELECVPT